MRCQWSAETASFLYHCDDCGKLAETVFLVPAGRLRCPLCVLDQPRSERLGERARIACLVARAVCRAAEAARTRRAK